MPSFKSASFLLCLFLFIGCASFQQKMTAENSTTLSTEEQSKADPQALQHFIDGQFYLNEGNYPMAVLEFQDALASDSTVGTIHLALGESYWHLGKIERSEYHLKKAISLDPHDLESRELLAGQYLMRKQFEDAIKQFTKLNNLNSDNVEYILALADIMKLTGQYDEAISLYYNAYKLDDQAGHILEAVVEIHLERKEFALASEVIQQLITFDPQNVNYKKAMVDIALMNGDLRGAIKSLEEIINKEGPTIDLLLQIGWLYFENKNFDSSLEAFLDVVEIDSTNQSALHSLSTIFREQENPLDSKYFAEKMIVNDSTDSKGYMNAALAAMMLDDYQSVIDVLTPVSEKFNEDYSIQYLLGIGFESLEEYKRAIFFLNRALELESDSKVVLHTLAMIYDVTEQWTKSDSIYQHLIQSDSTDAQAYNNFAYSIIERNDDPVFAKNLAQKAITLEPESAAYLDTYGWILYKLGDIETAIKFIRRSIEIEDSNVEVLKHYGDILFNIGRSEEAIEVYQKALEFSPDDQELMEKLNRE